MLYGNFGLFSFFKVVRKFRKKTAKLNHGKLSHASCHPHQLNSCNFWCFHPLPPLPFLNRQKNSLHGFWIKCLDTTLLRHGTGMNSRNKTKFIVPLIWCGTPANKMCQHSAEGQKHQKCVSPGLNPAPQNGEGGTGKRLP